MHHISHTKIASVSVIAALAGCATTDEEIIESEIGLSCLFAPSDHAIGDGWVVVDGPDAGATLVFDTGTDETGFHGLPYDNVLCDSAWVGTARDVYVPATNTSEAVTYTPTYVAVQDLFDPLPTNQADCEGSYLQVQVFSDRGSTYNGQIGLWSLVGTNTVPFEWNTFFPDECANFVVAAVEIPAHVVAPVRKHGRYRNAPWKYKFNVTSRNADGSTRWATYSLQ